MARPSHVYLLAVRTLRTEWTLGAVGGQHGGLALPFHSVSQWPKHLSSFLQSSFLQSDALHLAYPLHILLGRHPRPSFSASRDSHLDGVFCAQHELM